MKPGKGPEGGRTIVLQGTDEVDTMYEVAAFLFGRARTRVQLHAGEDGAQTRANALFLASMLFAWMKLAKAELAGQPALEFVTLGERSGTITLASSSRLFRLMSTDNGVECHIDDSEGAILYALRDVTPAYSDDTQLSRAFRGMLAAYDSAPEDRSSND